MFDVLAELMAAGRSWRSPMSIERLYPPRLHRFPEAEKWTRSELLRDESLAQLGREGLTALAHGARLLAETQSRGLVRDDVDPATLSRLILATLNGLLLQSSWQSNLHTEIERWKAGLIPSSDLVTKTSEDRRDPTSAARCQSYEHRSTSQS